MEGIMLLVCLSFNTAVRLVGGLMIASLAPSMYAGYVQINLTSNIPGLAAFTDPNLVNPWGFSFSATSPFWISDNGSAKATLYNAAGAPNALIVSTPPEPTGQVFNGSASSFALTPNNPARFIFATESGQIAGWNPAVNPTAAV